ncbi:aspartate aminotransferase family protein [Streptomyces rugosispiralis]|uniref:Aspartate aminotransferase family protein n=1 Tax=Streptomyces rugosispiralis TaxID=2967341 RepID=A0ABT1UP71_9ACTN|nr:aspartate aminotransferase family protein [Streptomyces rugosispiralis]MCQ8186935.1 aspartate aminotransferase family protein [Streptomyces rugosispiralis]
MSDSLGAAGVHMANGFDPREGADVAPEVARLLQRRDRVLGPAYRLFYEKPVAVREAHGARLTGHDGRVYLDAYNNVPVIGHSHPKVRQAVAEQLGRLNTHTRYLTEPIIEYSERLLATFPDPLSRVTYACTGSEAVDLAIRIARHRTGRSGIIISQHAYHGTTVAAAQLSPSLGPNNRLGEHVVTVPSVDTARTPVSEVGPRMTASVRRAVEELEGRGDGVAAVIFDSVLSSDGVQTEPAGFLRGAAEVVRAAGGLYIADEVQAGFGRTGGWWGFERHGLLPDLAVLGKPMGNGMPISAVVGTLDAQERFGSEVRYFNTFGGNPVSIAAAAAVLDVLEEEGLLAHARHTGDRLLAGLRRIMADNERVFHVRGAGMFLAADLGQPDDPSAPDPRLATRVVNGMREAGVLISASGPAAASLKIRPPLAFTEDDADELLEVLEKVVATESRQ